MCNSNSYHTILSIRCFSSPLQWLVVTFSDVLIESRRFEINNTSYTSHIDHQIHRHSVIPIYTVIGCRAFITLVAHQPRAWVQEVDGSIPRSHRGTRKEKIVKKKRSRVFKKSLQKSTFQHMIITFHYTDFSTIMATSVVIFDRYSWFKHNLFTEASKQQRYTKMVTSYILTNSLQCV